MASSIQAALQSELQVTGMNCANCARHVTDALQGVAGVASADVSLQEGRAQVPLETERPGGRFRSYGGGADGGV